MKAVWQLTVGTAASSLISTSAALSPEATGIFDYGKGSSSLGGDAATNDPGILSIFYSRRIGLVDGQEVPIIGGARVTGRLGDYSVGVLNIATGDRPPVRSTMRGCLAGPSSPARRERRTAPRPSPTHSRQS